MSAKRQMLGCLLSVGLSLVGWQTTQAAPQAEQLLRKLGVQKGLCVVLGDPRAELAGQLAKAGSLVVYVQIPDRADVAAARRAMELAGLDATRITIDQGAPRRIHLADNLANAMIVLKPAAGKVPEAEILRVLAPRGKALVDGKLLVKPVPAGIDDWTHGYHSPDNNTQSKDRVVVAPYMTQFLANPRYGPAPQMTVAAAGKVFKVFGNVAWHEREEPYLNTVVAYDGYNGAQLWTYKLPDSMMVHRNVFVATPELLYIGDDKSCKRIDTVTGRVVDELRPPVDLAGGTFWKWMALQDGVLYAMVGRQELEDGLVRWKRTQHGWPWNQISRGFNQPKQPWGFGRSLLAIDPETKKVLWHYHEKEPMDGRAVCMNHERIFAFRFGAYLTCLDAKTGDVLWRKSKDNDPKLFATLGPYLPRQSWQTNWRTVVYLKCSEKALYFAGPQLSRLVAVSAENGEILWQNPYDNFQLIIRADAVYGISGPWGKNVSKKFDPLTGKVLGELPTGRRACTRPSATSDSILFRAMGGSVRFDLKSAQPRWISPMRPACQDGVTVAGGLLYWWPYVCDCQLSLYGVTCAGSAGDFDFTPDWKSSDRLQTFANADQVKPLTLASSDWPMFRANCQATATTQAVVPRKTHVLWSTELSGAGSVRPTAPVAAGDLVFVAGDDGAVRALDTATGKRRWKTYTGGEVRLPPTICDGRALVGSGDGWVYAYEATSGRSLWRFQAAPAQRMIPVYGKLLSTWPAASGVVVDKQNAYVAAGLANYDGTYVYALDPATGKPRWCNDTSGHLDSAAMTGVGVQGHLLLNNGKLYMAGGNAVSPGIYDVRDGHCLNDPAPLGKCESTSPRGWELFLVGDRVVACGLPYYSRPDLPVYDHTVTKKILHTSSGGRDIVWLDDQLVLAYPTLDWDELNRCVTDEKVPRHITQAWGTFKVKEKPTWAVKRPAGLALAVNRNAVVVAQSKQVVALDIATGQPIWSHDLPAAPVRWGMAVDRNGRVILTLTNGQVLGIGG